MMDHLMWDLAVHTRPGRDEVERGTRRLRGLAARMAPQANGFISLSGTRAVAGNYNPDSASGYPLNRTLIFYVWDTALGSGFTGGQFGDMLTGGFPLGAGLWRVKFQCTRAALGSETATSIAVSTLSGNTTTDHVIGRNELPLGETAAAVASGTVEDIVYSATGFTIYAKAKMTGAVGDKLTGSFQAEKLRDA